MTYKIELDQTTLSNQAYRLVIFDDTNQVLGDARGEFRRYAEWYNGQKYFFLDHLFIPHKANRHQGLGTQLLKALEEFAHHQGACCIRGQFGYNAPEYGNAQEAEHALRAFWGKNGYGIKREVYDECLRVWKPLYKPLQSSRLAGGWSVNQ